MNSRFGRPHSGLGRGSSRDKKLFLAAAVLAMSLVLVLAVVFKFKVSNATQEYPVVSTSDDFGGSDMATVTLLSPERPIKAGTNLADVKFKTMYWPRNQVPEGAIRDVAEVTGKYARIDLAAGAPIEIRHLTDQPTLSVLPLTPGNRAVTINIDAETAIEYHVLPGTSVDVVLTHYVGRDVKTKVIVQNARVLSLGGSTNTKGTNTGGRRPNMRSKTVTLDVSPKNALEITTAKQLGKLSLLLRNQADDKPLATVEVEGADVTDQKKNDKPAVRKRCTRGRVKIAGDEYIVDCDGKMYQAQDTLEP